jgi:hypothetical protein
MTGFEFEAYPDEEKQAPRGVEKFLCSLNSELLFDVLRTGGTFSPIVRASFARTSSTDKDGFVEIESICSLTDDIMTTVEDTDEYLVVAFTLSGENLVVLRNGQVAILDGESVRAEWASFDEFWALLAPADSGVMIDPDTVNWDVVRLSDAIEPELIELMSPDARKRLGLL